MNLIESENSILCCFSAFFIVISIFSETDAGFNPTLSKVQLFEFSLVLFTSCCFLMFLVFCVMLIWCMNCCVLGLGKVGGGSLQISAKTVRSYEIEKSEFPFMCLCCYAHNLSYACYFVYLLTN